MNARSQTGAVSAALIVVVAFVSLIVFTGIILAVSYVSAYNYGNRMEQDLTASQTQAKNVLAEYGQKVQEAVQVPKMYADSLTKLAQATIQGRYGASGSQATVQMLREAKLTLDPKAFQQVQQIIEGGRDNFQAAQTRQIDLLRQYRTALGSFYQGFWLRVAGYPKVDLKSFDIVSTDYADEAFKTHKESGPLKLQ